MTTLYRTAEYERNLKSARWARLREEVIVRQWGYCGRCAQRLPLELHHRHYRTLGAETAKDVVALCHECHVKADEKRAAEGRTRSAIAFLNARWEARVRGWADAVGYDGEDVEDAFRQWLDDRGED